MNDIQVTYDSNTKRFSMKSGFHLVDVMREFPSRRFDPKHKVWKMPLVKANIDHLESVRHKYTFKLDESAQSAVDNFKAITIRPPKSQFPYHLYDFSKSEKKYEPMEHQRKMMDLAWSYDSFAWFAKMGTGKTFAAIHVAMARWMAGQIDAVVIICPSTLRKTWMKELAKFATCKYDYRIHETKATWLEEFYSKKSRYPDNALPILGVSVEGLGVSTALYGSVCGFYVDRRVFTIVDESSRIKNPDAKRTERVITLGTASAYRAILNGTPIALGIQDLYSQYEFLDPNIIGMGDYWAFRTRFLEHGGYDGKQLVGYKNVEELMEKILPYTVEVGKDVLNLPPKVPVQRYITLTPEQRTLIRVAVKGKKLADDPDIKVSNSLEKRLRCRQIVGGWFPKKITVEKIIDGFPALEESTELIPLDQNPKLDDLIQLIEDNYAGSKFIIWTGFVHEIEHIGRILAKKYGECAVAHYYGLTDMDTRSQVEDRYCNDPTLRIVIANPTTAGLGLTFISGENDVMVYYSGTDAYIDRAQSEDRSHRIGQNNSVTIVDLIAEKSVDEVIFDSIQYKMSIEEYIMTKIAEGYSMDSLLLGEATGATS